MAEVLDVFPETTRAGVVRAGVAKFLDGRVYRLVNGVDIFYKNENAAKNAFYIAAYRRGLGMRLHVESRDPLTVVVQSRKREATHGR